MQIVVRTRFFDEALLRAARVAKQVVILAAGMDARAYRLAWPDGTTVYELDQPAVIAAKADLLADDAATLSPRGDWYRPGRRLAQCATDGGFRSEYRDGLVDRGLTAIPRRGCGAHAVRTRGHAVGARIRLCCTTLSGRRCWSHR